MPVRPLKVLHLATFDTHGGAAVAAIRLIESQRRRGHDARLLVREKATSQPFVEAIVERGRTASRTDPAVAHVAWFLTDRARSPKSDAPFSADVPTFDVASHPAVRASDVLHLHWVAGFLSSFEIGRLQQLRKPLVWTLHDQFPFTGGCHYTQGCRGFVRRCDRCPQLLPAAQPLARLTLAQKRDFIDPAQVALASPSRWLMRAAEASLVFRRSWIDLVPNGIDIDSRQAVGRDEARRLLDLDKDALVVFAASVSGGERRKGHAHLLDAMRIIRTRRLLRPAELGRLCLLTAGDAPSVESSVRSVSLGSLAADDPRVAMAYRAADVFALPSLEDNLPNTLIEAMAAGIPVVAYRTGGIPDAIKDDVNGRLVERGNVPALARALAAVLRDPALCRRLGDAAAATARQSFSADLQARRYEAIYDRELARLRATRGRRPTANRKRPARHRPSDDAPKLRRLAADPKVLGLVADLLRNTIAEMEHEMASRGGEIRDWRTAVERADLQTRELLDVIAARGGEIRDLWAKVGQMEAAEQTMQGVIASRGGEIRDLWNRVRSMEANERTLQDVIAARGGEIRDLRTDLSGDQEALLVARRALSRGLMEAQAAPAECRVGIFGAGEGGRKVLEAALAAGCGVLWIADNNPAKHGHTRAGLDVIAPAAIPSTSFDIVVIGSTHRNAIREQLIALGVAPGRILAPDVSRSEGEVADELRRLLAR